MRIIRAIIEGERDPSVLAEYQDVRCKESQDTIRQALTGNFRPEHVFALRQSLELYEFHQTKAAECDAEIEAVMRALNVARPTPEAPLPKVRHFKGRNEPEFAVREAPLHVPRCRSQSDPRLRTLQSPAARSRVQGRHAEVADREALHVVVEPGTGQQDLGRPC
jgi:hypothetical protein